jgi:hypothetical protein
VEQSHESEDMSELRDKTQCQRNNHYPHAPSSPAFTSQINIGKQETLDTRSISSQKHLVSGLKSYLYTPRNTGQYFKNFGSALCRLSNILYDHYYNSKHYVREN